MAIGQPPCSLSSILGLSRPGVPLCGVTHQEKDRELVIPISRVPFVRRQRLASLFKWRAYDRSASVPSEIRIGHVVGVRIDNRYGAGESETELERGLTAKGHKISLVSVAEDRGMPFFLLEADVDLFDITISDKEISDKEIDAGDQMTG